MKILLCTNHQSSSASPFEHNLPIESQDDVAAFKKAFFTGVGWETSSRKRVGLFTSDLMVVRTDSVFFLTRDLFVPNLTQEIGSFKTLPSKILMGVVFLIQDLVTLPFRLLSLIPRLIYNRQYNNKEKHPFYLWLKEKKIPDQILKQSHIYVEIAEMTNPLNISDIVDIYVTFNFIELRDSSTPQVQGCRHQFAKQQGGIMDFGGVTALGNKTGTLVFN